MEQIIPSLKEILSNSDRKIQEVIQIVDSALKFNIPREELVKTLNDDYWDNKDAWTIGMAYLSYIFPGEYVPMDYGALVS